MAKTILNEIQKKILSDFKKSSLKEKFYLSGETALAEFYLHHRLSEDLDFFTQEELDLDELKIFVNSISKRLPIKKIEFLKRYGLYTFF